LARLGAPVDYNPFEKKKATGSSKPSGRLGEPVDFNPFEPKPQMGKYVPGNLPMSKRAQRKAYDDSAPLREQEAIDRINAENPNRPQNIVPNVAAGIVSGTGTLAASATGGFMDNVLDMMGFYPSEEDYYDASLGEDVDLSGANIGNTIVETAATAGQNLRQSVADTYPMPAALERLRARQSGKEGWEFAKQFAVEPIGAVLMLVEQLTQAAPFIATMGPVGGSAALEAALGGNSAADSFDAEWDQGIIQQSQQFQELAKAMGPEEARSALRAKRVSDTQVASGIAAAAASKLTGALGLNPVEQAMAGKAVTGGIGAKTLKELIGEPIEEIAVQIPQNAVDISTGSNKSLSDQVTETAITAAVMGPGTSAIVSAPATIGKGISAIRNRLTPTNAKGNPVKESLTVQNTPVIDTSNAKGASPVTEPLKGNPVKESLTVQNTPVIDTSITAPSSTAPSDSVVSDTVIPITDKSFSRAAGTNSLQQESQVVKQAPLSISDAGTIIDNRLASLREAATRDRLDDGTVKSLTKEDEDLRLTLQENEKRVAAGILQTPERPYLSEDQKKVISQYRAEIREKLEKHRAAVGYGNQLSQMETDLSKLGESDQDVVRYAQRLLGDSGTGYTAAKSLVAPTTSTEQSQTVPSTTLQTPAANVAPEPIQSAVEAPVTSTPAPVVVETPKPEAPKKPRGVRNRISTPEQIATQELQQRVKTDPEYRARIEANRTLFLSDIQNRAAEIAAQQATQPTTQEVSTNNGEVLQKEEGQRQQQQGQGPEVTPAQLATGTTSKSTYASEQELKDDLFSGWMDPLASNAQKMDTQGRLVVYNGLSDLDTKDPQAAKAIRDSVAFISEGRKGAGASAFAYNGKVYLDVSGVEKGQAKSKFLHEAMVHVSASLDAGQRSRVDSLASRVDAWAKAGDKTAMAAIGRVLRNYPGVVSASKSGNAPWAVTNLQEEKLAKYAQMLYDKYGGDAKGMVGTAKRLYNDIVSYFREKISRGLKARGFDGLQIRDRDILDAVRYGRDVTAFKDGTYTPGQATTGAAPSTSSANMASPDVDAQLAINTNSNSGNNSVLDVRESSLYKAMGNAGIRALVAQGTASSDVFRVAIEERAGFQRLYVFKAEMLAKEVEDIISRLSKAMPDRAATRDKYRSLAAQYFMGDKTVNIPQDLKNVTDEFRNIVTDLQVLGIAYGVWSPKSVPRIMKSFGKWSRRAFQVFDLNPGEWKAIQMGLAARGEKDVVTQELPNIMDSMKLPSADEIRAMGVAARRKIPTDITKKEADKRRKERDAVRAKMNRYAESWGITSKKFKDIENQLIQLEAMGPDKLREKAIEWGTRLLDPRSSATFSPMIGPKNTLLIDDSSVDKARKQVPEWLQRLWGRHERIDSQALISIEHLATIVAKYRAMTDLLSAGLADGSIIAPGDVTRSKRGYKKLDSDNPHDYGPLQGHWIKEEDAWLLEQSMYESALAYVLRQGNLEQHAAVLQQKVPESYAANAALATATLIGPIGRMFKQLQVNFSLSALFINTASAFTLLAPTLGSWTAVKAIPQSVKIARSSAFAGIPLLQAKVTDAQLSKDLDYLMTKGLLQDGALAAQSRKQAIEKIREESNALRSGFAKRKNWAVNAFTSVFDVLSRMNSFGDETAKLLTFYARRAWNQQVFGVSESEAADMAVEEVKDTMPSYTRTSPIAKALSNLGVIGAFIGWHAEMIRTTVNLARTAGSKITKGIKDGNIGLVKYGMFDLSQIGLRTMSMTLADAAVAAPVFALVSMLGADDEEEKQIEAGQKINSDPTLSRAMYELLPGWNKSNVHVSRDLGDGTYVTYTTRRYEMMPWGQMISAVAKDDPEAAMSTLKDTFASIYPTAIAAPGLGVAALKWFKADNVKDSAAAWDEVEKYSRDLGKSLTAGSVRTGAKILSGDEKTGVQFTEGELAMEVAGFSPTVVDLGNIISQHVFQYTGAMDDEKRRLSKDTYSEDGAIDLFSNASLKYDLWKEARRKVEALKAMGYDYDYFHSALDRNPATANVSKKERKGLWEGYFILPDYTEFLNDRQDTEIERNPAKESEITAKYDEYRKRLEEDWPKIESMLNEQNVNYYED